MLTQCARGLEAPPLEWSRAHSGCLFAVRRRRLRLREERRANKRGDCVSKGNFAPASEKVSFVRKNFRPRLRLRLCVCHLNSPDEASRAAPATSQPTFLGCDILAKNKLRDNDDDSPVRPSVRLPVWLADWQTRHRIGLPSAAAFSGPFRGCTKRRQQQCEWLTDYLCSSFCSPRAGLGGCESAESAEPASGGSEPLEPAAASIALYRSGADERVVL